VRGFHFKFDLGMPFNHVLLKKISTILYMNENCPASIKDLKIYREILH